MSTPWKPLKAVIKSGADTIGSGLTSASRLGFSLDVDEYYGLGDEGKPTLIVGNQHFSGSFTKAWLDKVWAEKAIKTPGTKADIIFYPEGVASGKPTITVKNAIFEGWDFTMDRGDIVAEGLAFKGDGLEFGTYTPP